MIFKIILIACFIFFGIYLVFIQNTSKIRAWRKIAMILFGGFAIFSVLYPQATSDIAHWLGVGRGADLLFYLTSVALIYLGLHSYVRSRQLEQRIVILTRQISLLEADQNSTNNANTSEITEET